MHADFRLSSLFDLQVAWVPVVIQEYRGTDADSGVWHQGNRALAFQVRSKKITPSWVPTRQASRFFGNPILDINPEFAFIMSDSAFNNAAARRKFLDTLGKGQRVAVLVAFKQVRFHRSLELASVNDAADNMMRHH